MRSSKKGLGGGGGLLIFLSLLTIIKIQVHLVMFFCRGGGEKRQNLYLHFRCLWGVWVGWRGWSRCLSPPRRPEARCSSTLHAPLKINVWKMFLCLYTYLHAYWKDENSEKIYISLIVCTYMYLLLFLDFSYYNYIVLFYLILFSF